MKQPMLACNEAVDVEQLTFPCYGTAKFDGIRSEKDEGRQLSRSLKPIPNKFIVAQLADLRDGLDGELIVGKNFQETDSAVMTEEGEPDFTYHVFDDFSEPEKGYLERVEKLKNIVHDRVRIVLPTRLDGIKDAKTFLELCLAMGYEGAIIRSGDGIYKFGRSTFNEGIMLKLKEFLDDEAVVVGFKQKTKNNNKAKKNEVGRTHRSSHKANKEPLEMLGAFIVEHPKFGRFNVGSGMTHKQQKEFWLNRNNLLGKLIKFKYQKHGMKDKPRCPIFHDFRHPDDL